MNLSLTFDGFLNFQNIGFIGLLFCFSFHSLVCLFVCLFFLFKLRLFFLKTLTEVSRFEISNFIDFSLSREQRVNNTNSVSRGIKI